MLCTLYSLWSEVRVADVVCTDINVTISRAKTKTTRGRMAGTSSYLL